MHVTNGDGKLSVHTADSGSAQRVARVFPFGGRGSAVYARAWHPAPRAFCFSLSPPSLFPRHFYSFCRFRPLFLISYFPADRCSPGVPTIDISSLFQLLSFPSFAFRSALLLFFKFAFGILRFNAAHVTRDTQFDTLVSMKKYRRSLPSQSAWSFASHRQWISDAFTTRAADRSVQRAPRFGLPHKTKRKQPKPGQAATS